MCGIVGKVYWDRQRPVDLELLERMASALEYRGPDDAGVYSKDGAGLGHRRLSIIDLSPQGRQPMCNEDGTLWLVFNGEIYNYPELREQLLARGHRFRSTTDSEVLLHLYEDKGEAAIQELRGMFAFALWDAEKRVLLLARDRVGKKPLYYRSSPEGIWFASQPKALLVDPEVEATPDLQALDYCLGLQYIPAPFSAFRGIQKLRPAHYLVARDGQVSEHCYWTLPYGPKLTGSAPEIRERFLETLVDAVRVRLIADVPLGVLLSGGLDSSAVVAVMAGILGGQVRTFSAGFQEQDYNELEHASTVAQRFGTEHTAEVVTADAADLIPRLAWLYDEPFGDSSALPTYLVAQAARRQVKVVLNGDGGDESLAGYQRYFGVQLSHLVRRAPRGLMAAGARLIGTNGGAPSRGLLTRARRFLSHVDEDPWDRYFAWVCHFDERKKRELYTPEFLESVDIDASRRYITGTLFERNECHPVDAALGADVQTYLPGDLLVKMDVATMAHGLEGRSPFLDHHLMELAARLPIRQKLRAGTGKYVLKRVMAPYLPRRLRYRRKQGFGVPIEHWFRGDLRELLRDVLLDGRLAQRGYFQMDAVEKLIRDHETRQASWHFQLWNLMMMELWHRNFVDGDAATPQSLPRPPATARVEP